MHFFLYIASLIAPINMKKNFFDKFVHFLLTTMLRNIKICLKTKHSWLGNGRDVHFIVHNDAEWFDEQLGAKFSRQIRLLIPVFCFYTVRTSQLLHLTLDGEWVRPSWPCLQNSFDLFRSTISRSLKIFSTWDKMLWSIPCFSAIYLWLS